MPYNSEIHHRQSIRLPEYDYSQSGYYFITICTKNRENIFGEIKNKQMLLSAFGQLVKQYWWQILKISNITLDAFVVMPNHMHGIIIIKSTIAVGAIHELPLRELRLSGLAKRRQMILFKIIGRFKMNTAKQINILKNTPGLPIWQRNYYEHIVRDKIELFRIREYIKNNPINWNNDRNNI